MQQVSFGNNTPLYVKNKHGEKLDCDGEFNFLTKEAISTNGNIYSNCTAYWIFNDANIPNFSEFKEIFPFTPATSEGDDNESNNRK